jgi:hypothetical protein
MRKALWCGVVLVILSVLPVRLIRFGGHLSKGGYDVHTDGQDPSKPAPASAIRR